MVNTRSQIKQKDFQDFSNQSEVPTGAREIDSGESDSSYSFDDLFSKYPKRQSLKTLHIKSKHNPLLTKTSLTTASSIMVPNEKTWQLVRHQKIIPQYQPSTWRAATRSEIIIHSYAYHLLTKMIPTCGSNRWRDCCQQWIPISYHAFGALSSFDLFRETYILKSKKAF